MIHGEGPTAYLFDAETAQALGLAEAIRRLPGFDATRFRTDLDILTSVLLTCRVHFFRGISHLGNAVNQQETRYLESICYMYTEEEVTQWRKFCSGHKEKRVRDWYENKAMHAWFIPLLCPYYTKIRSDLYADARKDTNLVESQHALTNSETGIRLSIVKAVITARRFDSETLRDLEAQTVHGIQRNRQSSDIHRTQRAIQGQTVKRVRNAEVRALEAEIQSNKEQMESIKHANESLTQQIKEVSKPRFGIPGKVPLNPSRYRQDNTAVGVPVSQEDDLAASAPAGHHDPFQPPAAYSQSSFSTLAEEYRIPDEVLAKHFRPPTPNHENLGHFLPDRPWPYSSMEGVNGHQPEDEDLWH